MLNLIALTMCALSCGAWLGKFGITSRSFFVILLLGCFAAANFAILATRLA